MDDPKFNDLLDKISDVFDRYRNGNEDLSKAVKNSTGTIDKQKKLVEILNKRYKDLDDQLLKGKKKFIDLKSNLDTFNDQIEDLEDSAAKLDIQQKQSALAAKYMAAQFNTVGKDLLKITAGTVVQGLISGTKKLVTGLQSGASGVEISSGLLTTTVDVVQTSFGAVAKAGETVGQTMTTSTNPRMQKLGVATSLVSGAFGSLMQGTSELAKTGIEILSKEVEKTIKAFNDMSASGALFTDGMTGMRNAASGSGLTIEQFSRVVKDNSTILGEAGLGVAQSAKKVGAVGDIIKKSGVRDQLLKLGYSFEEQAQLTAETIANMRRSAGGMVSNREVAQQTQKYAENLRYLASVTGEDAKRKAEQVKQENTELAFQQRLAEKSASQRAQIDLAMSTMTEVERKNLRDRIALGVVVNQEGAIYEATLTGAREKGEAVYALFEQNRLTAQTAGELNVEYGKTISDSAKQMKEIGIAAHVGVGGLEGVAKGMADVIVQSNTYTKEGVTNALKGLEQATTPDTLTNNVVDTEKAIQDMRVYIESEITKKALPAFTGVLNQLTGSIMQAISAINGGTGGNTKGTWDALKHIFGTGGTGAMMGGAVGGMAGTVTVPVFGTVAGGALGAAAGFAGGVGKGIYDVATGGYANGGIASGPVSGFQTTLHGTEAVVPLPDGGTIPVKVQESTQASAQVAEAIRDSITQAIMPQTRMLNDILDTLRDGNKISNGILNNTY